MNSLLASLRFLALILCTLLAFGFGPVPFTFGVIAQSCYPRRLPPSAAAFLGTAGFLVAWLALDNVPFAFFGRNAASFWPLWMASWLFSMADCQYAILLVRAWWPRRFARRPTLGSPLRQADHAGLASAAEPLGLQDFRITMRALRFWLHAIKGSVIAFAATLIVGFVSMGLLGVVLYYPVAPVLEWWFAPREAWHGD